MGNKKLRDLESRAGKDSGDPFAQGCKEVWNGIAGLGVFLLMLVFPLILHDSYFDILETKYRCYWILALGTMGLLLLLGLIMAFIDAKEHRGRHIGACMEALKPRNWKKTFLPADLAVLAFWLLCGISTVCSDYFYEAFWGNEGRYSGFFLITIYVAAYFAFSRLFKPGRWPLWIFLASGMAVCLFGITDYFRMDIMGFYRLLGREQAALFTSTMGNINTYTTYAGLVAGVSAGLFCTEEGAVSRGCSFICMVIAFSAGIMGRSDNAYLCFAGIFMILPFVICRTVAGVRRYLEVLAAFASVMQVNLWIAASMEGSVVKQGTLFGVIARVPGLWLLALLLWAAVLVLAWQEKKHPELAKWESTRPAFFWGIFLVIVIAACAAAFLDANVLGHAERYSSVGNFLIFNDSWGTERGYIWRKSWELFRDFPLRQKLFGYGPDTFSILTYHTIRAEMIEVTGKTYDNAHNEYLQYLLTLGWAGLAAYLSFLVLTIVRMVKDHGKNPVVAASLCAVAGYAVQALVNLNLPIAAPMFWLLLTLGRGALQQES